MAIYFQCMYKCDVFMTKQNLIRGILGRYFIPNNVELENICCYTG